MPLSDDVAARKTRRGMAVPRGGREASKLAACVLEVLAGLRTPTEAAQALGVAVTRYYHLENRAVQGLVAACEPRPLGRVVTAASQLSQLQRAHQRLQRDHARQQALLRTAQRALGLTPPPAPDKRLAKRGRKRRPSARALTVVAQLQAEAPGTAPAPVAEETVAAR